MSLVERKRLEIYLQVFGLVTWVDNMLSFLEIEGSMVSFCLFICFRWEGGKTLRTL